MKRLIGILLTATWRRHSSVSRTPQVKPLIVILLAMMLCLPLALATYYYASSGASPTPEKLWWKLNEGSGTTVGGSASGGGDGGATSADWITGKSGSGFALDFNGTSDESLTSANITYGVNVITVCAWLYSDSNTGFHTVWGSDWINDQFNVFTLYINGTALTAGMTGTTGQRAESIVTPGTGAWYHLMVVYDSSTGGGDIKMYLDGVLQGETIVSDTKTGTSNFAAFKFGCGYRINYSDLFYDGRIDDVRIYTGDKSGNVSAILADPQ